MAASRFHFAQLVGPTLATLALTAALMALYVSKHGGHPSALLCAGANRAGQPPYEAVTAPGGPNGYDGQFYYAIARNPWRIHDGELIDNPAARHQRIFYPALCWLCSGGHARVLLWIMPLVNLLAVGGLAALGAWFAVCHGRSAWWGMALPVSLNAGLPALHNLTDPVATLALAALLAAWMVRGPAWLLALCATAALLGREQNLVVVGILALAGLYRRRGPAVVALSASVLLWAAWVVALRVGYGAWPFLAGAGNFDAPLAGICFRWAHPGGNDGFSRRLCVFLVASMLHLTLQIGLAGYLSLRRPPGVASACMLAGVALALVGGSSIYCDFWSYTRVFVWLPLGIWLQELRGPSNGPLAALLPAAVWPVAGALRYV